MNWKIFLKPDLRKIIVFIIILILAFFVGIRPINSVGQLPVLGTSWHPILWFPGMLISGIPIHFPFYTEMMWSDMSLFGIFLSIVYWYLVSCLIVWIFDKVKK